MKHTNERAAPARERPNQAEVFLDGEPFEHMPPAPRTARVVLRSFFNDDGHFQGLEVLS